jgi:hypothetical protein
LVPNFVHGTAHTPQCTTPHRARVSVLQHMHHNAPHHTGHVYRYCSTYTTMHHTTQGKCIVTAAHTPQHTTMHHTTQGTCIVTAAHTPQYTTPHRARVSLLQTQASVSLLQTRRAAMCKDWVIFKQAFAIGEERTPLLTFFPRWLSQCCLQDNQQPVRQHGIQRVATVTRVCDTRITGACVTRCLAVTAACPYRVRAWGQESRHLGTCAS